MKSVFYVLISLLISPFTAQIMPLNTKKAMDEQTPL